MSFRDNLQHLRATRNMTQEQLAMLLGVSRQSVTKWEAEKSYPEMDKLLKLCSIFECSLDELVQGDLTDRPVDESANTMPKGPAADVYGYDEHMRAFAFWIPTGIACIVIGVAWVVFFDGGPREALQGGSVVGLAGLFLSIIAALACFIPAGMKHSSFVKEHPYIEDFYTAAHKERARKRCAASIVVSIGLIFIGVLVVIASEANGYENLTAQTLMLLLVAVAVWLIVNSGMLMSAVNLNEYNANAVEELEIEDIVNARLDEARKDALMKACETKSRKQKVVGSMCGIIMLLATAAGLALMFSSIAAAGGADAVDWENNFFWMAWVVGGICCGIVSLIAEIFYTD